MTTANPAGTRNPFRLLMRIPVPWVFILMYILGAVLEHLIPLRPADWAPRGLNVVGGVLFGIGAIIAGWGLVTFRVARTTTVPGKASSRLVDCVSLNPAKNSNRFIVAGYPLNEELIGPSSAAWGRLPGEYGKVAFVTTDGGAASPLPDGVRRPARLLRVEFPEAPAALRSL